MGDDKCQKCPKGKYMLTNCISSQSTECKTCPLGQFIDVENSATDCWPCRQCSSSSHLVVEKECQPEQNTWCKCGPGYYCKHPMKTYCDHCTPVSTCPLGQGVAIQHTPTSDTVCKPCPTGTYSDKVDNWSSCKNHTSCDDLGRQVKIPGTNTSDVQCGDVKCNITCSWALPAGLWAGFVLSVLVVFLVLFVIYWRNKRRSKSLEISLSTVSPVLPPDILKYPVDCDVEKCAEHHNCLAHIESYPDMDGRIQCDGAKPLMTMSPKYSQSTAASGYTDSIMQYSICQSEPQESEWTD